MNSSQQIVAVKSQFILDSLSYSKGGDYTEHIYHGTEILGAILEFCYHKFNLQKKEGTPEVGV